MDAALAGGAGAGGRGGGLQTGVRVLRAALTEEPAAAGVLPGRRQCLQDTFIFSSNLTVVNHF